MEQSRWMRSMLLDVYGALLTEKQRECYDLHFNEDLSLSEIAEQSGISRQGVWDNIRRAEAALLEIEAKTGLVRRMERTKQAMEEIRRQAKALEESAEDRTRDIAGRILQEIDRLED